MGFALEPITYDDQFSKRVIVSYEEIFQTSSSVNIHIYCTFNALSEEKDAKFAYGSRISVSMGMWKWLQDPGVVCHSGETT